MKYFTEATSLSVNLRTDVDKIKTDVQKFLVHIKKVFKILDTLNFACFENSIISTNVRVFFMILFSN